MTYWVESMQSPEELREALRKSNAPFTDSRSADEKALYSQQQADNRRMRADRSQFERYRARLGDEAPKTFSQFRKLKKQGGEKWEDLQKLYRSKFPKTVDNSGESGIIKTIGEAHDYLNSVFGSVEKNVSRLDEQLVIDNTEQLRKLNKKFGVLTNKNTGYISGSRIKATAETYSSLAEHKYNLILSSKYYKSSDHLLETEKYWQEIKFSMPVSNKYLNVATITHEYGHMLQNELIRNRITPALFEQYNLLISTGNRNGAMHLLYQEEKDQTQNIYNEIIAIAKELNPDIKISEHISKYGKSDYYEAFAEIFMNSQCGEPNELGKAMNIFLERSGYV